MSPHPFSLIRRPGILNRAQIHSLISAGVIGGWNGPAEAVDKSSFDLHLGERGWKLPASLKARADHRVEETVAAAGRRIAGVTPVQVPDEGLVVNVGETFLFEMQEWIELPDNYHGQGTGKSSIGRLDVLTRLLADREARYDYLSPGRRRRLYVEVTPLSFPLRLCPGDAVYQVRLAYGSFGDLRIPDELLRLYSDLFQAEGGLKTHLRLNLEPVKGEIIAYRARRSQVETEPLRPAAPPGTYDPAPYWEIITRDHPDMVELEDRPALRVPQNAFHILVSQERFTLPPDIAVYAVAMTEEVGELRVHHAGFIHPGFGSRRRDRRGTPLIFEVRGHDVDIILAHGDLMAELRYYSMSEPVEADHGAYDLQELQLSRVFRPFAVLAV